MFSRAFLQTMASSSVLNVSSTRFLACILCRCGDHNRHDFLKLAEACNPIYTVFRHGAKSRIKTNNEKIRNYFRDPMVTAQITPGRTLRHPRAAIEDSLIPKASVEVHYLDLFEGKSGPSKDSLLRTPEHSLDLVAGARKKRRTRNQGQL